MTPASLEFWGELLLAILFLAFLVYWQASERDGKPDHRAHYLMLTLVFYSLSLSLLAVHISLLKTERMPAIAVMYSFVLATLFAFAKFIYRMPDLPAAWRHEERFVTLVIFAFFVVEVGYGIFRLASFTEGRVYIRPEYHDVMSLLVIVWLFVVLLRQTVRLSERVPGSRSRFRCPRRVVSNDARAAQTLLVAMILLIILSAGIAAQWRLGMSRSLVYYWTSLMTLAALLALMLVYVNYYASKAAFVIQITGVIVMLVVLVVGAAGRSIMKPLAEMYADLTLATPARSIRFTPVAPASYQVDVLPLIAAANSPGYDAGRSQAFDVRGTEGTAVRLDLPFEFPFFGRPQSSVYLDPGGFLTFDAPLAYSDMEYRYGPLPAIFALYRSKLGDRTDTPERFNMQVREAPDQVVIRWSSSPGFDTGPGGAGTVFQVVLNADGAFAIEHLSVAPIPLTLHMLGTNEWVWRTGISDGNLARVPQHVEFAQPGGQPIATNRTLIEDYELTVRRRIHPVYQQLSVVMLVSVLMAVGAMPLFLRTGFMQPLERLLRGIERTQAGDLSVQVPVHSRGEIAAITTTFNGLVARQRDLLENLEAQVDERTAQLAATNQELEGEIQLRRQAQLELEEFNRVLDARVQERTRALTQTEERFRRVVTSISDQVFAITLNPITREATVDYLSEHLMEMLGIDATPVADLLTRWRDSFVAPEDAASYNQHMARLMAGYDSQLEYRFLQPGGNRKWVYTSVRCERLSPCQIRCYGVVSDISDRKQLEEETARRMALQEVDRLRSEWLGNMSHELRTPLGLIKTAATTLLATDVTIPAPMQQQLLEQLDYETDRMTDLVNALLDLARVDAGRLRLHYSRTDVAELLFEVTQAAQLQIKLGALPSFVLEVQVNPPAQEAVVDSERMKRVIQNLLANAIKFSPENSQITLRALTDAEWVLLEVEDHGIGVDEADFERIFERYYQIKNPGLRSQNGVGLGLPICREIVVAHGGTIAVKSRRSSDRCQGGTTVTVRIPRQPPAQEDM